VLREGIVFSLLLFYFFFCLDTKEAKNQGFANKKAKSYFKNRACAKPFALQAHFSRSAADFFIAFHAFSPKAL
jgi:hypothetical protein